MKSGGWKSRPGWNDRNGGARLAALHVLVDVLENRAYSNLSSESHLKAFSLDARDRAFASALIYGTLTRVITIDALLAAVSSIPLDRMEAPVLCILRMGVWQILYSRSVPPHAACSESVALVSRVSNRGAAGMVNGILRRIASAPPVIPPDRFAMVHSLPDWLADRLIAWFGAETASVVAEACNEPPPLSIRVNRMRTDPAHLAEILLRDGVTSGPGAFHPDALHLDLGGRPVGTLQAYAQGLFMVQDEAAMLVSTIASPRPGQSVVDVCAAPGGKSCHMAEIMGDKGRVLACDLHPSRLRLVEQNTDRLGLGIVTTRVQDAVQIGQADPPIGPADLVLCDVPCSGLGLLARKPEIRLNADPEEMAGLPGVQVKILDAAAGLVRPGGTLVYSTCTLDPAENGRQADRFLAAWDGVFSPEGFASSLPAALTARDPGLAADAAAGRMQLLPGRHACDGFYMARFRRSV
ncbi:MAG: 16S rRNA (cytosine(967)-C(5))-methyltransferase RsmB [Clostridia bacterium]|nr:16S rRNA (cytosine(967)-C(5))-methyltransferase RsmB [Clostridia bacterium]